MLGLVAGAAVLPVAYAIDADGDGQAPPGPPGDCNDGNYYVFTGAINIPFDGTPNNCILNSDSKIYDENDANPPSVNATYIKGNNVTIVGSNMGSNVNVRLAIVDTDNRTVLGPTGKITDFVSDDKVWTGIITTNSTGGLNKTISLPDLPKHPPGVYTMYIWFTDSLGGGPGKEEWLPFEYFTVIDPEIYDSRDTNPPSSGDTYNLDEDVLVNGTGWEANSSIVLRINDSAGSTKVGSWSIPVDGNGNFTDLYSGYTVSSGDADGCCYEIFASTDSGSTWTKFDEFTVDTTIPEFPPIGNLPIGESIMLLSGAAIYWAVSKTTKKQPDEYEKAA